MIKRPVIFGLLSTLSIAIGFLVPVEESSNWSQRELSLLKSLSISALPELPPDRTNNVSDVEAAAELGHALYFDVRLSGNKSVACSSCHQPTKYFTDGLKIAVGTSQGLRHTPSLVGVAYSPWFYWDGRKDSQWSQALAPLETSHEQNGNRLEIARLVASDENYRQRYEAIFGKLPIVPALPITASPRGNKDQREAWESLGNSQQAQVTKIFSNIGKSLAAYQRKLIPGNSRFDTYIDELDQRGLKSSPIMSTEELAGLSLFIGKAGCVSCHNGPLLTNHEFHNTGILTVSGQLPSMGRYDGIRLAREDPFNCLGKFSDATEAECLELTFAQDTNDLVGAQKTPTLRNVSETFPYMHGGQLEDLLDVMDHYNKAPTSVLSHNEAKPLKLRATQLRQLEALMHTFTAPLSTESKWLKAPE